MNNPVMYVDSSGNFPSIASIIGGIAVAAVVSVIVVLVVKNCISENTEKEKTLNDLADAIVSNIDPKDVFKFTESVIKPFAEYSSAKPFSLQPYGAGGYEIPNGDYNSYSGGRAVFDPLTKKIYLV